MTIREHDIKCTPQHFAALWSRIKAFELRYRCHGGSLRCQR